MWALEWHDGSVDYVGPEALEDAILVASPDKTRPLTPRTAVRLTKLPPYPAHEARILGGVLAQLAPAVLEQAAAAETVAAVRLSYRAARAEAEDYSAAALPVPPELAARLDAAREAFRSACQGVVVDSREGGAP
jgi:hypothetical protein